MPTAVATAQLDLREIGSAIEASPARVVPPAPSFTGIAPWRRVGTADVRAHHGEIVQGVFYDADGHVEQGLVTLPCSLYGTHVQFRPLRAGPLTVEPADRRRAHAAARLTLDALGRTGWGGVLRIGSNVPLGWGCGSSTTDVVATIRAVADAFGVVLPPEWMATVSVAAETASDSLMYATDRAVLFAQRRGRTLHDLGGPLPQMPVLGVNTELDRGVGTLSLPPCKYSSWEIEAFRTILGLLRRAVEMQDPILLGRVASASAEINQRHRPKRFMPQLVQIARQTGAAGLQVAHSGTVVGFLFEPGREAARRIGDARTCLRRIGLHQHWEFSTRSRPLEDNTHEHTHHQRQLRGGAGAAASGPAARQLDRTGVSVDEAAAGALHHPQGARTGGARTGTSDRRVHVRHLRAGAGDGRAAAAPPADPGE
jgi:uncharacterized protein involved in propanediol utilization